VPVLGAALRGSWRRGYGWTELRADLMAGAVVGVVALPLSMALAIASGVPPQHGLYTAIVAGFIIALLGGSPVQVSGPTAAFVVILAPIASRFGLGGLLLATLAAGVILFAMGAARMGQHHSHLARTRLGIVVGGCGRPGAIRRAVDQRRGRPVAQTQTARAFNPPARS